jgi:hexosaminidase
LLLSVQQIQAQVPIVPIPQQVSVERGIYRLPPGHIVVKMTAAHPTQKSLWFSQLKEILNNDSRQISMHDTGMPDIWIGNPSLDGALHEELVRQSLWPDERIGEQGYIIRVSKDGIVIAANTDQGLFYGVQSLKQLIKGHADENIPAYTITDWPAMPYRGVMDDISRGPVPHLAFMKEQVRRYAELKINMMSFYIEHVIKTEAHGSFAPAGGHVTVADMAALSAYARDYHIELVGSFQTLGHFEKILAFPQYAHLGETNRMLSPVNPASADFVNKVIAEMLPAFSSDYFNINGDEAWDLGRGSLKKLADSIGIAAIYAGHMNRIIEFIRASGKKVMMWGDITLQHPEVFTHIPEDVMILTWDYSPSDSFGGFIDPIVHAGFDFMVCPGVLNSNRLMPDFRMTVTNIRNFVNEGYRKGAKGVLTTVWDDGGVHAFSRDWYGIAFGAEQSWHPNNKLLSNFDTRLSNGIYTDTDQNYVNAIHKINELTDYAATQGMNSSIFSSRLFPDAGSTLRMDMTEWEEIAQIADDAKAMAEKAFDMSYGKDVPYLVFTIDQYRFLASSRKNILQAATKYTEAIRQQDVNPTQSRRLLVSALELITRSRQKLLALQNQLKILWLEENKIHWYDQANDYYQKHIIEFDMVVSLLESAIADFDEGHYLPAPNQMKLAIEEKSGQYFTYFLMAGPFHIDQEYGPKPDFLGDLGGESNTRPIPGLIFTAPDGKQYMWDKYDFPLNDGIDLLGVFEKNETAVVYAYCQIESPDDRLVKASFGSNDGIAVFCNGEKLFEVYEKRNLIPDENEVLLPLKAGTNHILIKIDQWKGSWGFSFRLPEHPIRNHKHKYRIIQKP